MSCDFRKPVSRNALKLGGKSKDVDSFVDQLKSEGQKISTLSVASTNSVSSATRAKPQPENTER